MRKAIYQHQGAAPRYKPRSIFLLGLLAALLSLLSNAYGQDAVGSLEGHISDKSGAVVNGATVVLRKGLYQIIRYRVWYG